MLDKYELGHQSFKLEINCKTLKKTIENTDNVKLYCVARNQNLFLSKQSVNNINQWTFRLNTQIVLLL